MATTPNLQSAENPTRFGNASYQHQGNTRNVNRRLALILFWVGLVIIIAFAGIANRSLILNLRTLTAEELDRTIWQLGGPLFMMWAFSVPLGLILASIGAFLYVKTKPVFSWFTGIGVLVVVILMNIVWSRVYNPTFFGISGGLIVIIFFSIVWIWMKKYAELNIEEKIAGSLKLIGYLFWMNASWFLCGETSKMHLKAFEGSPAPSPIEIMVFLVLGWLFVLLGEYKSRQARTI